MTDPLDYCPGCQRDRPLSQWALANDEAPHESGPLVCRECRASPETLKDLVPALPARYRKILRDMMTCNNVAEVARRNQTTPNYVRTLMEGRAGPASEMVRAAFHRVLEMEGLDLYTIARIARLQLHALEPKWNPSEKRWDWFPDNGARGKAIAQLTKLHQVEPKRAGGFQQAVSVEIHNNLGGARSSESESAFTIDVTPGEGS